MIDASWYERPEGIAERVSAGGMVIRFHNGQPLVALVREVGLPHYVLPKGGVEVGESLEEAARREIHEEAGLTELELVAKLGLRERLVFNKAAWVTVHYFLFCTKQKEGTPIDDQRHYGLSWFPLNALPEMFWPEQRELIESYHQHILSLVYGITNTGCHSEHSEAE